MSTALSSDIDQDEREKGIGDQLGNASDLELTNSTVILSIVYRKERLGVAVYDGNELRLMREHDELSGYPTVQTLLHEIEPNHIIIPGRGEYDFVASVKSMVETFVKDKPNHQISITMGLANEYKYTIFLSMFSINQGDQGGNCSTIAAASALTSFLKRQTDVTFQLLNDFEWFSMSEFVSIDYDSLLALQLLDDERHPNMHVGDRKGGGLSIFNLINKCKSAEGKRLLKSWIMRPLKDINLINYRLDLVDDITRRLVLRGLLSEFHASIRALPRIRITMNRLFQQNYKQLLELYKFIQAGLNMNRLIDTIKINNMRITNPANVPILQNLLMLITGIVDINQTKSLEKIVIRQNVNMDLDRLRQRYNTLPADLNKSVQVIAERIKNPSIRTINVVYFPQLGFLVAVSLGQDINGVAPISKDDFELQFATEKTAYFKDPITKRLDAEIGDIYADIIDLEIEIIRILIDQLAPHRSVLIEMGQKMAEFECLVVFAEFAYENNLIKPTMVAEPILSISNGRHLLQERAGESFVPNDCKLADQEKVAIITGPNGCGKSVYVKQIALIIVLAQMGSFVPAEAATIGLVDRIFTRIQTRESVISGMSAFQTDLIQIKKTLEGMTENSLLLIDEFGKGTAPCDGIALFGATIKYLCALEHPPRTLAITHFHEIYQQNLLQNELALKWHTMDMLSEHNSQDPTFLFKIIKGKATDSLGIHCAKKAGLPETITNRAESLFELYKANVPPISIRYAALEPEIEQLSIELVTLAMKDQASLDELCSLACQLLKGGKANVITIER